MPTLNYDETISDVINNDENWEDEVYGLLDSDEIVGEALDDEGI